MNLRDKILQSQDLKEIKMHIDEWDVDLIIRELTGSQRDAWEESRLDKKGNIVVKDTRSRLAVLSIIDPETNKPAFTLQDLDAVGTKSANVLQRIFDVVVDLNFASAESIEEEAKN